MMMIMIVKILILYCTKSMLALMVTNFTLRENNFVVVHGSQKIELAQKIYASRG